jgi:hypothetical protein
MCGLGALSDQFTTDVGAQLRRQSSQCLHGCFLIGAIVRPVLCEQCMERASGHKAAAGGAAGQVLLMVAPERLLERPRDTTSWDPPRPGGMGGMSVAFERPMHHMQHASRTGTRPNQCSQACWIRLYSTIVIPHSFQTACRFFRCGMLPLVFPVLLVYREGVLIMNV